MVLFLQLPIKNIRPFFKTVIPLFSFRMLPYDADTERSNMKTVLVFGTFDIIHPGHQWFLRKAASYGDRLVAVVSRDRFVRDWKGKSTVRDEVSRIHDLEESGLVDQAVLSDPEIRTYRIVDEIQPDIICLGHDQSALLDDLKDWLQQTGNSNIIIEILPPWHRRRYSSSRRNRPLKGAGIGSPAADWTLTVLLVISMVIFGFSWVSGKRLSTAAPPLTLTFIRFTLTMFCFIPLLIRRKTAVIEKKDRIPGWLWTAAAALSLSSYNLFFFLGLETGLAGKGGLIVTTLNPFFTFLIVSIVSGIRIRKTAVIGIVLGFTGGILLLEPWRYNLKDLADSGNIAFLSAAMSWSFLTIFSRKALQKLDFRIFNLRLYALAALMVLPFALFQRDGITLLEPDFRFWSDMIFISAAVSAFGTGVYFAASSRLGAARASAFTYLVPVFALSFTSIILGEAPQMLMITGGLLALAAVVVINRQ